MNRTGCMITSVMLVCCAAALCQVQQVTRSRGEGFYRCESANTVGPRDLWVSGNIAGFIWDSDTASGTPKPVGTIDIRGDIGFFNIAAFTLQARPLFLDGRKPGIFDRVRAGVKLTLPDNRDLRVWGPGIALIYQHGFLRQINKSLGGYQDGSGTGFSPAGVMVQGPVLEIMALGDFDAIALKSWLPVKAMLNSGIRIPLTESFSSLTQYVVAAGIGYVGINVDVFVEYHLEAFVNRGIGPKQFAYEPWMPSRHFEVAFSENPMYVTIGGRYRYENGIALFAYAPLLLSVNQGTTMSISGDVLRYEYPDEHARGISDGFDPWYARWKIILGINAPLRFAMSGAEMRRNFLLLKNRKHRTRIDFDARLKVFDMPGTPADSPAGTPAIDPVIENQQRLDAIKKRREQLKQQ